MNKLLSGSKERSLLLFRLVNILLIIGLFSIKSCGTSGIKIDIDELDPDISIMRLEKDLFAMDIDSIPQQLPALVEKYGDFFELFSQHIIRIGNPRSSAFQQHLIRFLTDFDIYRIHLEIQRLYPDLDKLEKELEKGFKHYMFYFPGYQIPQIYTYLSGFNQSVVVADSILAVGLDKYLGAGHKFYAEMQLPYFQRVNMYPEKIPSDCMISWAMSEFEFDNGDSDGNGDGDGDDNLLSHIIYHGKFMYFANAVLPHQHDTLKTGFSLSQLEWCRNNETQMWTYLVENRLLFSTDAGTIGRFINKGPFTSDFSRESPARAAVWLGCQIIESYMNRHKEVSLKELMIDTDYQGILNRARYRP